MTLSKRAKELRTDLLLLLSRPLSLADIKLHDITMYRRLPFNPWETKEELVEVKSLTEIGMGSIIMLTLSCERAEGKFEIVISYNVAEEGLKLRHASIDRMEFVAKEIPQTRSLDAVAARLSQKVVDVLTLSLTLFIHAARQRQLEAKSKAGKIVNCLLLIPASDEFRCIRQVVVDVLRELDVEPIDVGATDPSKAIFEYVRQAIESSEIIIADLTGRNPNVMYELGIAHTLRKSVLPILRRHSGEPPFDLGGYLYLVYDMASLDNFRNDLRSLVAPQLRNGKESARSQ